MDFFLFMIPLAICAHRHFVLGLIVTAVPLLYYLFKRQFNRADTIALILMVLAAGASAAYAVIHIPIPV